MKYGKPAPGEEYHQYSDQTLGRIVFEALIATIVWFLLLAAVIVVAKLLPAGW